jgi:mono/diheme cytochrome c family protein
MTRDSARIGSRYLLLVLFTTGIIAIAASVGSMFGAEVSTYSRGASVYTELGCGTCHESLVLGPIQLPRKPAPHVFEKWIETSELLEHVRFGSYGSDDYAVAQRSIPRKIKMPAYNDWIAESDLRALLVFLQVNQLTNMRSKSAGQNLARKYGCFDCHGPLGLGGVVNPRSFKGYIPGWFGSDFDELTNGGDREIVAEWIVDGTSAHVTNQSFGRGMIARHFGESQTIKMPAFERRMPSEDLDLVVDYVLLLRSLGDVGLDEAQQYRTLYALDAESSKTRLPRE